MAHKLRQEMITETRSKLISAARQAFAEKGYAAASMDEFTAEVGLTRGALYHHFGDKKGMLRAVAEQLDNEMAERLRAIVDNAPTLWDGFINETVAYIEMALDPQIQRIMLLDGPAVLGSPSTWPNQSGCIRATTRSLEQLQNQGSIRDVDTEATARLINGAALNAALWIANSEQPKATSDMAVKAFKIIASGLLK